MEVCSRSPWYPCLCLLWQNVEKLATPPLALRCLICSHVSFDSVAGTRILLAFSRQSKHSVYFSGTFFSYAATYHSKPVIMSWEATSFAYCLLRAWVFSGLLNSNCFSFLYSTVWNWRVVLFPIRQVLVIRDIPIRFQNDFWVLPFPLWYLPNVVNNNRMLFNILFSIYLWDYIKKLLSKIQNIIIFITNSMGTFLSFSIYLIFTLTLSLGFVVSAPSHTNFHDIQK